MFLAAVWVSAFSELKRFFFQITIELFIEDIFWKQQHLIFPQLIFGLLAVRPQRQGGTAVHPGWSGLGCKAGRYKLERAHIFYCGY